MKELLFKNMDAGLLLLGVYAMLHEIDRDLLHDHLKLVVVKPDGTEETMYVGKPKKSSGNKNQ